MNLDEIVENACDRAEFNKAYNIRQAVGALLSELESIQVSQYGVSSDVKGTLKVLEEAMEDVMYDTFSTLDQKGNYEFRKFIEAVREAKDQ